MSSWSELLVEWCNCLQLNPKIKDIKELRRSDFFKNILSILNAPDLLSKIDHTFLKVLTLLNDTYKHAQIDDINCDSFVELPEDKLILIISLLMHYTCIYDGRENFTVPLCQNLSKKSQLSIKNFLQNVNKEVTYSDLKNFICKENIHENVESKPTHSPLTEVFRTPSLKRKFNYEKDRAVTKLKTALELEQYEKADVEDELRTQIKKTQKLEKLLSKSNIEINSLKSEIFKLKCQTPPQCSKKPDLELTVKFLRKELENFEHYIENNEKEHEQLREEHHIYKKKIEEYELEYAELQKKYLAYHEQIDELTEMLSDKSSKITHLETYCEELNEILEGYRQQRPVSTECSFSEYIPTNKDDTSIINPENLASTVIEIQLKESQELNVELMSKVNNLNNELSSTKKYLNSKVEENKGLLTKIHSEAEKLSKLKQEVHNTKRYFEVESNEYKMSISCLQKQVNNVFYLHETSLSNLNTEILTEKDNNGLLSHKLAELEINIAHSTAEKDSYLNHIKTLEKQKETLSTEIQKINSELLASENNNKENLIRMKILEEINQKCKEELAELISDKNKCMSDLEALQHQNNMLSTMLEEYSAKIKTLENNIEQNEKELNKLHKEIEALKQQNNMLYNESEQYRMEIKTLQDKIEQNELELTELHSENDNCNAEIESLKQQNNQLNTRSEEYCQEINTLQDKIGQNEIELDKLHCENVQCNNQIEDLEHQNHLLYSKSEEYCIKMKTLEDEIEQNKIELAKLQSENNQCNGEIESLKQQTKIDQIRSEEYYVEMKTLGDKIKQNEINLAQLHSENDQCNAEIEALKQQNNLLNRRSEEYCQEIKTLQDKIGQNEIELDKLHCENVQCNNQIEDLKQQNHLLDTRSEEYCIKLKTFEDEIEQNKIELAELRFKNNQCNSEIETLKKQNNLLNTRSEEYNIKIKTFEDGIEQNKIELAKLKSENDQCNGEIESLKQQTKIDQIRSEEYYVEMKTLGDKIEQNEIDLAELRSENDQCNAKIKALKQQNNSLKTRSEEYCTEVTSLEDKIEKNERKLDQYNNEIETLKQQNQLLNTISEEYCTKVETLEDRIEQNKTELAELYSEKHRCINEIEDSKQQNNLLNARFEEYCASVKTLEVTIERKETELVKILSETNQYVSQIEHLNCRIEKLTSNLVSSENNNEEYKNRIKVLETLINEYSGNIESLNELLQNNAIKLDKTRTELDMYINQKNMLQQDYEKCTNHNNDLSIELKMARELNNDIKTRIEFLENKLDLEKTNNSKDIQILKENVENNDTNIILKDALIQKYEKGFREIQIEMVETKKNFNDLKSCFKNEKNLLYKLMNDLKEVNGELVKCSDTKLHELEAKLLEEQTYNKSLQNKVCELENQLISEKEKLVQEVDHFKTERNNFCDELRISEKKNNEISNRIVVLQDTLDLLNLEKTNYLQKMEKQCAQILELENTISSLRTESESIKCNSIHLEEVVAKYKNSEKKLEKYVDFEKYIKQHITCLKSFHKKEFFECNNLILKLKESINLFNNNLVESEQQREKLVTELSDCKNSNLSLLIDLENVEAKMNQINSEWSEDKKLRDKINNENLSLKEDFIGLTKTINMFNNELNKIMRSLKERKTKSDFILNDLQMAYKEFNTGDLLKTPEKNHKTNDVSVEINNLGEQLSKLNAYIDIFSEKETYYLKELDTMKEEITASNNNNFEAIQNLKEQIIDNEHQLSTQTENLHSIVEKYNLLQLENQKNLNEIEKHADENKKIIKNHSDEIALKDLNIVNLQEKVQSLDDEISNLKKVYNGKTEENLEKLVTLQSQKSKIDVEIEKYKTKIISLEAQIAIFKDEILHFKKKSGKTEEEYETTLANLQVQVVKNKLEITEFKKKNEELITEKDNLFTQVSVLNEKNNQEFQSRKIREDRLAEEITINRQLKNENSCLLKELDAYRELQETFVKYEEEKANKKFLEEKLDELSQKIETLMKSSETQKETYGVFKIYYKKFKDGLDKLLSQKNSLENLTNNMRTQLVVLNRYTQYDNSKKLIEKKEALDIISEDIMKQYNRYSKQINDIVQEVVRYYEKNCDNIFASLEVKIEDCLEKYNIYELGDQLSDLTERAVDILEQIRTSQKEFENICRVEIKLRKMI